MLLGDLIERLEDEALALETLLSCGDLALVARVEDAAGAQGLTAGEFTAQAVGIFASRASDEDWVSVIGAMGRTASPGEACLRRMIEFALSPIAEPGGGCGHHHAPPSRPAA